MAGLNSQVEKQTLENTPGLEAQEEPKSPLSILTEIVKNKTKTTLKTATAAAILSASIVHAEPSTETVKVPVEVSTEVQAFSPEDQKVYEEYVSKLPPELKSFALELMKWREEFKKSFSKTEKFKKIEIKYKAKLWNTEKFKKRISWYLENAWKSFANQLLDWKDSRYYDDVIELAPNLSKYIYENKDNLLSYNSKMNYWLDFVITVYETEARNKETEELNILNEKLNKLNWNLSKITG